MLNPTHYKYYKYHKFIGNCRQLKSLLKCGIVFFLGRSFLARNFIESIDIVWGGYTLIRTKHILVVYHSKRSLGHTNICISSLAFSSLAFSAWRRMTRPQRKVVFSKALCRSTVNWVPTLGVGSTFQTATKDWLMVSKTLRKFKIAIEHGPDFPIQHSTWWFSIAM